MPPFTAFDINRIIQNPNTKVILQCYGNQAVTIQGFLTNDTFAVSGNATFNDLANAEIDFGDLGQKIGGTVGKVAGGIANMAARASGISRRPAFTTLSYWDNTEKPQFSVDLLFVRYSMNQPENTQPTSCVKELVSRCYPNLWNGNAASNLGRQAIEGIANIISGAAGLGSAILPNAFGGNILSSFQNTVNSAVPTMLDLGFFEAPCGYNPIDSLKEPANGYGTSRQSSNGTWSLEIGNWFRATGLLLQNAQFEMSRETDPDGKPIYAQGAVQLESSILITYQDYYNWFKK